MARLAYGSELIDRRSGLRIVGHHPGEAPRLWQAYLEGAAARYRRHGVEAALERDRVADGRTVSLFWVALDGDRVVAGVRCHGPLASATEARALVELADHPHLASIRADLAAGVGDGLVEMKGGWVAAGHPAARALSAALGRCHIHSADWFAARFAVCTSSTHALATWRACGGVPADHLGPVAYPDERYETYLLWWDRQQLATRATPEQLRLVGHEAVALAGAGAGRGASAPAPARDAAAPGAATPAGAGRCGEGWRPVVLREDVATDLDVVAALRADPRVEVDDRVADQRGELAQLQPTAGSDLFAEPPRWVYYPWRRSLVRLLGPRAFRRVRTDRNRNKLTPAEQDRLATWSVGVVGLSVGHAIAHALALEGLCGRLVLADFDHVALSNLNRLPATVLDLDVNKAVVAARRVAELDPYLEVDVWPDGIGADRLGAFLAEVDLVVEECDSLDLKLRVREAARQRGVPVVMETSDRGLLDVERFDRDSDRPPFHGLVADLRADDLQGLSTRDKSPHVARLLEPHLLSARMAASMAEIDRTVSSWPQLGGDVALGAAAVAAALRRLARGDDLPSGRLRIDLDGMLDDLAPPAEPDLLDVDAPVHREPPPADPVAAIAHAAHQAPSGGNAQPWRLEPTEEALHIHLDPQRTSTMDVGFRGSYTAIGAALLNARAAASAHARLGSVSVTPDGADPVATLTFGEDLDLDLAELYPALLDRCTNRRPGEPERVDPTTIAALEAAAEREGAHLTLLTDADTIAECAEVLAESDRLRHLTPWLHRELVSELRWPGRDPLDVGIDVRTLELDDADLAKLAVARRSDVMTHLATWDAGAALGEVTGHRVRTSSALAAVTVSGRAPADYVRGGAAVQRLWGRAQLAGLAVQPVSPIFIYARQPHEYTELVGARRASSLRSLAERLHDLVDVDGDDHLVLLLRLSHAPPPSRRSARRSLHEVVAPAPPAARTARSVE